MKATTQQLKKAVIRLSFHDRQEIAEALIASFATRPEIEAYWDVVVERRMEDLRTGKAKGIPAEEVFREARKMLRSKGKKQKKKDRWAKERTEAFLENDNEIFPDDEMILKARTRVRRRAIARGKLDPEPEDVIRYAEP